MTRQAIYPRSVATSMKMLVVAGALAFTACKKDPVTSSPDPAVETIKAEKGVYVIGDEYAANGNVVAKIWRDGNVYELNDSTKDASARSVFVTDDYVYVAGFIEQKAVLWKNGIVTELTDGKQDAGANSVFVSGKDVYTGGYESNGKKQLATFWKNGVPTVLSDGSKNESVTAVFVSGSDVYALITAEGPADAFGVPKNVLKLWKNGTMQRIGDTANKVYGSALFVSGADVYIAGQEITAGAAKAKVWKNNVPATLAEGTQAYSVFVSGSDTYVAGHGSEAMIWKNGVGTALTENKGLAEARSVYVSGADVYVAGRAAGFLDNNTATPVLWKNSVATALKTKGTSDPEIFAVFVKE